MWKNHTASDTRILRLFPSVHQCPVVHRGWAEDHLLWSSIFLRIRRWRRPHINHFKHHWDIILYVMCWCINLEKCIDEIESCFCWMRIPCFSWRSMLWSIQHQEQWSAGIRPQFLLKNPNFLLQKLPVAQSEEWLKQRRFYHLSQCSTFYYTNPRQL